MGLGFLCIFYYSLYSSALVPCCNPPPKNDQPVTPNDAWWWCCRCCCLPRWAGGEGDNSAEACKESPTTVLVAVVLFAAVYIHLPPFSSYCAPLLSPAAGPKRAIATSRPQEKSRTRKYPPLVSNSTRPRPENTSRQPARQPAQQASCAPPRDKRGSQAAQPRQGQGRPSTRLRQPSHARKSCHPTTHHTHVLHTHIHTTPPITPIHSIQLISCVPSR